MRPKAFTRRDMVTHIARRIISDYVTAGKIGTGNRPKSPLRDKESFSTSVFFQKERRPAARQQPIVIPRDVAKWHGKAVDLPADMASGRNWRGFLGCRAPAMPTGKAAAKPMSRGSRQAPTTISSR